MRIELWRNRGRVTVVRDSRGRFVQWQRIIGYEDQPYKGISVYGHCWSNGKFGLRRYEIFGKGRQLQYAVIRAKERPPKGRFVRVYADEFLANPDEYSGDGYWIDEEVESL